MANIEIKKEEGGVCCASCLAMNFDSVVYPAAKRVETLYSVRVGNMCFDLCEDCKKKLCELLNATAENF